MKTKRLLPLFLALTIGSMPAIAAVVRGRVLDSDGSPLPGTSVQVVSLPDSVRKAYMISTDKGTFSFKNIKTGSYLLKIEMVGMETFRKDFNVSDTTKNVNFGDIQLHEEAIMLQEAVVTGVKADVVAKQDTMEFNAGSYRTAPNANVNDLLKKLPGVEIGSDGSITSNGKTIKKILVDGKEFFGDDPQMATKNLPSDMVDKIQVVDRKSDLARLTGVDDGEEETVINLTVKKNMNNGWFGNVGAGYGTDGRYQGSFIVNRFFNGNQITFLGGANNINDLGFSDRGRGNFRNFGGNGGINTSQRLGLNFNIGNDEIFRVGGNMLYSHTDRTVTTRTATQYLIGDSTSYQNANSHSRDKGHNVNSDFRIQWKPDEYNTFEFRPNFSFNFRNSESVDSSLLRAGDAARTLVNRQRNLQTNRGNNFSVGGNLIYNHRVASHPGRSFSVQMNYSYSNNRQKSTTWSDIEYYLLKEAESDDNSDELLYRFIDNHSWSNSIRGRLSWTEPLGDVKNGNFLDFAYHLRYQWSNADKLTYNLPEPADIENFVPQDFSQVPPGAELSEILSNSFRNNFFTQEFQVGYKKVNKVYNLDAGLLLSPSMSKSTDLINSARNIPERWVWNVSPYARFRYRFSQQSSLRAMYRANTSQPSMSQLQPVEDVSNPLNIVKGNPDLKPTFTQNINIHYNAYKPETQQATFVMFNTSFSTNNVVTKTTTNKETGGRYTTYTNANGNFRINGMFMMNRPLRNKKWFVNGRIFANYNTSPGYIDGEYNRAGDLRLSPSIGMRFTNDIFQISLNPTYSFGKTTNTLPRQKDQETHSYGLFGYSSLDLPCGIQLSTDLNFSKQSGLSQGFNTEQWLWNAQVSYSFLADKSLTFSVRAYDLLGQKQNISRSVSGTSIVDSEFNDLTRYVMFGLTWKFSTLKKKGKGPNGEDMMPGMMPPGGGRGPGGPGRGPGGPGPR